MVINISSDKMAIVITFLCQSSWMEFDQRQTNCYFRMRNDLNERAFLTIQCQTLAGNVRHVWRSDVHSRRLLCQLVKKWKDGVSVGIDVKDHGVRYHRIYICQMVYSQCAHGAIITSLLGQNDVATPFWRNNDVIVTSCVRWVDRYFVGYITWWWKSTFLYQYSVCGVLFSLQISPDSLWKRKPELAMSNYNWP